MPAPRTIACTVGAAVALVALGAAAGGASIDAVAHAQAAPRVHLGVHDSRFTIYVTSQAAPRVTFFDPELGVELFLGPQQFHGNEPERWTVFLGQIEGVATYPTLRPGSSLEIVAHGATTRVTVPAFEATSDAATDVVEGRAPWPGVVTVELAVEDWLDLDARPIPPIDVETDADGRFRLDLTGRHDVAPGTWGRASIMDPHGHRFHATFAEPFLRVPAEFGRLISIRADGGAPVRWQLRDEAGAIVAETRRNEIGVDGLQSPLVPYDPARPVVPWSAPGHTVRVEIDGHGAIETVVRGSRARYDPEIGRLTGHAPPGSWVRTLRGEFGDAPDVAAIVGADGRLALSLEPRPFEYSDNVAYLVRTGPDTGESFVARTPTERILLFGNTVNIVPDGALPVDLVLEPAGGGRIERQLDVPTLYSWWSGQEIYHRDGRPIVLRPGDRMHSRSVGGTNVSFVIPPLTSHVAPDGQALAGTTVPDATVVLQWTTEPPDVFRLLSPSEWWLTWEGSTASAPIVAGPRGDFRHACEPTCPMAQGIVRASTQYTAPEAGRPQPWIYFLRHPLYGVGIDTSQLVGHATSGSPVTATLVDGADRPVERRASLATLSVGDRLPGWSIDWRDRFPDGLPAGTRFAVAVAGTVVTLTVPGIAPLVADVVTDRVAGRGPAGADVEVWRRPNPADAASRELASVRTSIGADGGWSVSFAEADLRYADDLLINVVAPDRRTFAQLNVLTIDGPVEPTRTATPEALPAPTATPPPTPSPVGRRLLLPWARR